MKKLLFLLLIMPFFVACNQEDYLQEENESSNSESSPVLKGGSTKYDLLGYGYDVTGEYLAGGKNFQVIDIEAFVQDAKNKGRLHQDDTAETLTEVYAGATAEDFLEEIKTKNEIGTDGKFNIGIVSLGANLKATANINSKYTYSTKYSFARVDVTRRVRQLALNATPEMLIPYLMPSFKSDLNTLTPQQIINNYGTHVICDLSIGGRLQFDYRSVIEETSNRSEKKLIVKTGVNFNVLKLGANGSAEHELEINKELNKKNKYWNVSVKSRGSGHSGIGDLTYNNETGIPSVTFNLKEWEQSVTTGNTACIVDMNWKRTYPIYEFIADPVKKAQIKAAMESYIASNKVEFISVVPFYRYWNSKRQDHFYTQSYMPNGFDGWQYEAIACYVLDKKINNTEPLYEFWNGKNWDHLYTRWSGTPPNTHEKNWQLSSYIPAYIYGYQAPNTEPLYGFWNGKAWDHLLTTDRLPGELQYGWQYEGVVGYVYPVK